MKNRTFVSNLILILSVLFLIRMMVSFKTTRDEHKLFKIGKEALVAFNNNEMTKTNNLLKQGDKLYSSSKILRTITVDFNDSYNYINSSNTIKGRIALNDIQIELAKKYLLESARINSTPTLISFGPNMSLAKDLLQVGENEIVIEYLNECKLFWEHDNGQISKWKEQIRIGEIPEFGGNLRY